MTEQIQELENQKADLVQYLQSKLRSGDWHAIQDAASDIREINAVLRILYEQDAEYTGLVAVCREDNNIYTLLCEHGIDLRKKEE